MNITEQVLALPYWEKMNLCSLLQVDLTRNKRTPVPKIPRETAVKREERGQELLDLMEEILGEPVDLDSRKMRMVMAKRIIAYQLTIERYTTFYIGDLLHKDHSSITHQIRKMKEMLTYPCFYEEEINIWQQFKSKLTL